MSHIDEMNGLLYLEGQLDAAQDRDISAHMSSCVECRNLLQLLQKENIWLKEALTGGEDLMPVGLSRAPDRAGAGASWGWIAALGTAAAGIYTLWSGLIDPWLQQASDAGFNQGSVLTMLFFSGAFWKGWDAVQSMVEFLPMATVGIVVVWLLQRRRRRFTVATVFMAATLSALTLSPSAGAAEMNHGDPNYTLQSGQEVKTDLIVAAEHTRIDGDVDGDLIVSSRSITVNGHVKGDVLAFGQEVHVNGPVDGNVRALTQSLELNGAVGKNVMAWAREVDVDEKARVGGTITLGSANAQLDGRVAGDLLAFTEVLDMDGSLDGNAMIRAQRLRIGPHAQIGGQIQYRGGRQPVVESGARLAEPKIEILTRGRPRPNYASPEFYWRQILSWGAAVLFGLVLFLIAPAFFRDVENASKRFGSSLGLGALFLVAIPVAGIVACLTIVGLGVGITTFFVYLIAIYAAQVFIGEWLGEKLLGPGVGTAAAMGRVALGLAILHLLRLIPFAGGLIGLVVVLWGLGALVLAIRKRLAPQFAAAV
jgi:cytoskeletal protein CcmA (bactofilin family)